MYVTLLIEMKSLIYWIRLKYTIYWFDITEIQLILNNAILFYSIHFHEYNSN